MTILTLVPSSSGRTVLKSGKGSLVDINTRWTVLQFWASFANWSYDRNELRKEGGSLWVPQGPDRLKSFAVSSGSPCRLVLKTQYRVTLGVALTLIWMFHPDRKIGIMKQQGLCHPKCSKWEKNKQSDWSEFIGWSKQAIWLVQLLSL